MNFDYKARTSTKINDSAVGKLLNTLHMESVFYTHSTLTTPWALSMPHMSNCMMFHLILSGEACFEVAGEQLQMQEGDFVLFPKGEGHILSDGHCKSVTPLSELPIEHISERYETLAFGGVGKSTQLVCGAILFQHPLAIKLLGFFPNYIRIDHDNRAPFNLVNGVSELLKYETQSLAIGAEAVIARLADILVIATMRQYLTQLGEDKLGWLAALEDNRIGNALKLIHEQPEKHWSLEELALEIGMSRTSFARQFKQLVGNTPMDYLTEWRMSLAFSKLQSSKESVLNIALDIGYQSEAAFSRAFKKVMGKSPGEIRKQAQSI